MNQRSFSVFVIGLLGVSAIGCSDDGAGSGDSELSGTATLEVKQAPSDARCLRITAAGRRADVSDFDLSPGVRTIFRLDGLPTGKVTFKGEAFAQTCRNVSQGTVPGWISDSVLATIATNPRANVELTMRRNGRANVGVDFEVDLPLRFATYNASLNRNSEGQLVLDLDNPSSAQPRVIAEVIQRTNPDVVLINEFDYDPAGTAADLFRTNFLEVSQNGAPPVYYAYAFVAPSNTGIASGFDLNDNGVTVTTPLAAGYGDDALGFGQFVGQFGMAVFSKLPIVGKDIRTFQNFLWKDMPDALLPDDASTPEPGDFYSEEELAIFPLSSKSHWDIPVAFGDRIIHVLASHPTPPVFDGTEDRNGRRNNDEIRLWADYVTPGAGDYIYDDTGVFGGLDESAAFVILGDQNSDPLDGDSIPGSIQQLLENPRVNTSRTPTSEGAVEQAALQGGANASHRSDPKFDTADFADGAPGNLRADYVLPSDNLVIVDSTPILGNSGPSVFWPLTTDPLFPLVGVFPFPSSDHKLVQVSVDFSD